MVACSSIYGEVLFTHPAKWMSFHWQWFMGVLVWSMTLLMSPNHISESLCSVKPWCSLRSCCRRHCTVSWRIHCYYGGASATNELGCLWARVMKHQSIVWVKPGLYIERKSTPYTQTILRTWGRIFSATNADLRHSDGADAEYKHYYNTPSFTLTFARHML